MEELNEPILQRRGSFGDFEVYGTLFKEKESKKRSWHLVLLPSAGGQVSSDYWVSGTEFRRVVQSNLLQNQPTHMNEFLIGEATNDLPPAERQSALDAIAVWEGESKG